MPKRGKKYLEAVSKFDRTMLFDADKALETVVASASAEFDESVEVHIKLGVDGRHADQQVRGAIVLPHGTGKTKKVLVFAKGPKAAEAEAAGADYVGAEELAQKIQSENWFDFDVIVATPDMMGVVGRLGKVLGPKGLMPNPKSGTVTMDLEKALAEIKAGKVEYRLDKANIIHTAIGKVSFGAEKLTENFNTLMEAINKARPAAAKGQYLRSVTVASTMGPGVKVNPATTTCKKGEKMSEIKKAQQAKQVIIDEIKEKLSRAKSAVVIDYIGINVEQADKMRKELREADVDYTVYKNTLFKRAIEGTEFEPLGEVLEGPSAFALSYEDVTAPARVLNKSIKEFSKMEFKAAVVEGTFYDAKGVQALANIPGRDELIAKFMGSIQSPVSKAVRTFAAIRDAKTE